ncbi:hypothetical protein ACLOJK_038952 [Asimina triloba]
MVKTPSLSIGWVLSQEMSQKSFDIEIGGKRQTVIAEEFDDLQNQMGQEKCGAEPRHPEAGVKGNREITVDMQALAAETANLDAWNNGKQRCLELATKAFVCPERRRVADFRADSKRRNTNPLHSYIVLDI